MSKALDKYREQIGSYSKEEVANMNEVISSILEGSVYTEEEKEAIAFFYMVAHTLEN